MNLEKRKYTFIHFKKAPGACNIYEKIYKALQARRVARWKVFLTGGEDRARKRDIFPSRWRDCVSRLGESRGSDYKYTGEANGDSAIFDLSIVFTRLAVSSLDEETEREIEKRKGTEKMLPLPSLPLPRGLPRSRDKTARAASRDAPVRRNRKRDARSPPAPRRSPGSNMQNPSGHVSRMQTCRCKPRELHYVPP